MMLGWLGWTIVYAVVIWGIDTAYGLLECWLNNTYRRIRHRRSSSISDPAWTCLADRSPAAHP
jgi:hypothetical protein